MYMSEQYLPDCYVRTYMYRCTYSLFAVHLYDQICKHTCTARSSVMYVRIYVQARYVCVCVSVCVCDVMYLQTHF